jgi:starch-binding outer membrane protein, SusD/RagB family
VAVMQAQGADLKASTTRRPSVSYQLQPYMTLYPIPIREITLNAFSQNTGY